MYTDPITHTKNRTAQNRTQLQLHLSINAKGKPDILVEASFRFSFSRYTDVGLLVVLVVTNSLGGGGARLELVPAIIAVENVGNETLLEKSGMWLSPTTALGLPLFGDASFMAAIAFDLLYLVTLIWHVRI